MPTNDGGYYLVGARASHPGLFASDGMGTANALEALLTRARALGLSVHLTDPFYDIDIAADLNQLADELQRLPKKAPRTAYGAEEPLKNSLLMLSLEYGPVYLWLAYYCWAARRTKLSPGPQEVGLSTTGMQRYFAE